MIGNDVVDLFDRDADISSYRRGFDQRVFTRCERRLIRLAGEPARQRWRLWAAKEAAFKAARRCDLSTVFSPSAFSVELGDEAEGLRGIVDHAGTRYRVLFEESQRWIHAVALLQSRVVDSIVAAVSRRDDLDARCESLDVRALAREHVADRIGVRPQELHIRREGRIPWFWLRGRRLEMGLSLSHSGGIVAFACCEGDRRIG